MYQNHKYFQSAALERGPEYFEYENYEIQLNEEAMENYEIMGKIGRGKYSDVFKCINTSTEQLCVLKILKPVREAKIRREIKILKTLRGKQSIINLQAVMHDKCSSCYCLAYPFVENIDIRDGSEDFNIKYTKHYIFQILKGLESAHSQGIMHRDIKPQNILFDENTKQVQIADWGLADYYLPGKQYNVRVASRYYKGPELLLNFKYYGYSLDMWSLGCVFGGLIFQESVLFRGGSNHDQVRVILEKVGTSEIETYINKYKLKPDKEIIHILREKPRQKQQWAKFVNSSNSKLATKQAIDLLSKMLVVDHQNRITTTEAMKHPYFEDYHNSMI